MVFFFYTNGEKKCMNINLLNGTIRGGGDNKLFVYLYNLPREYEW